MENKVKFIINCILKKSFRCNLKLKIYLKEKNKNNLLSKIITAYLYESLMSKNHVIIGKKSKIKSISFPHFQNIVIGEFVIIGKNCLVYQDVTIGQNKGKYPIIGNNVIIYSGAKIVGDVCVGDNSIIGANSVVVKNIPENSIVAGNPANIIRKRSNKDEFY